MISLVITLLLLHTPQGQPCYVVVEEIGIVSPAVNSDERAGAKIMSVPGTVYVRESPKEIADMIKGGKHD